MAIKESSGSTLTHAELVIRAQRWLKNSRHCGVVCGEVSCWAPEIPDAIGFGHLQSTVVECKANRADFLRDQKKWHRLATKGMGSFRFYLCPPGLIKTEEIPERWGLLYCHETRIEIVKEATVGPSDTYQIMYSLMRRAVVRGFDPNDRIKQAQVK